MCVEADEIENGGNDASGTDGAKRRRVGDASGGASGSEALHEDGGGLRNSDELSATDLTQLAACDEVGLDLNEKESALLVEKRRECATRERQHGLSPMQGARATCGPWDRCGSSESRSCVRCSVALAGSARCSPCSSVHRSDRFQC
jgi:hypothetical protein